jgi:vesicle coat complex subunit
MSWEQSIQAMLADGRDRRSLGRSGLVIELVGSDPSRFGELFACLGDSDPLVRVRAAGAVEKLTREQPELLRTHKRWLLETLLEDPESQVRRHVAEMLPRLDLTPAEHVQAVAALIRRLEDKSRFVQAAALDALTELATRDQTLRAPVRALLTERLEDGSSAVRARARAALRALPSPGGGGPAGSAA